MNEAARPMSDRLPDRRARRTVVISTYAAVAILTALVLAADAFGAHAVVEATLMLVLTGAVIGAQWIMGRNVRKLADLPDDRLDERQLAERNRTYRTAYRVLTAVAVIGALYVMVALVSVQWVLPLPRTALQGVVVFWTVWLLAATLPSALTAWREPESLDEA